LLQRAIASASNDQAAAEHSELMKYLREQNDAYNENARILIDSTLGDELSKDSSLRDSIQVRVYDLDDPRAAEIRRRIKQCPADAQCLLLTVR
jgi:hypothetical protein